MFQGWATLAGVLAVIYAARVGSNTFEAWRRQKQEERRMEAAEQILTLAYRLRHNLVAIRSRHMSGGELANAELALKNSPDNLWNKLDDGRQRRAISAQVVRTRLVNFQDDMNEIWTRKPTALALFGPEIEARLDDLWRCHTDAAAAADDYADLGDDRETAIQLSRDMFSHGQPNPIDEKIAMAITALELLMLPVIRANYSD